MNRDEIPMAEQARAWLDREPPVREAIGRLSPDEQVLETVTREWAAKEDSFASVALMLAGGVRKRIERGIENDGEYQDELVRLADLRETAREHLENLKREGFAIDPMLLDLARVEGIEL